jgi:hypothetical protein
MRDEQGPGRCVSPSAAVPLTADRVQMNENFLIRYWKGEGSLFRVFWFYGVLFSTVAIGVAAWAGATGWLGAEGLIAAIVFLLAYTVWILVSVWRCAVRRGDDDYYAVMARWLTVAWAINAALVGGFILLQLIF